MISIRRANERGHADHGWLNTYYTFSFADYYDPRFEGFRCLRVINEDRVAPGQGFGRHAHRDMEIISFVLEGALEHHDSMGNAGIIRAGDVQRMSAGTGVAHSEANASATEGVHFLQIWIVPREQGLAPGYEQKTFSMDEKRDRLRLITSADGRDGSITIHQDVDLYAAILGGEQLRHTFRPGRGGWIQVIRGEVVAGEQRLLEGDGAAIEQKGDLTLRGEGAELLLFDLA